MPGDVDATHGLSPEPLEVLGVPISLRGMQATVVRVTQWVEDRSKLRTVTFSNAHMLALASQRPAFRNMLQQMDMNCADGMPVAVVARFLLHGGPSFRVPGPDFMAEFCRETADKKLRHFFLGGAAGVAAAAAKNLKSDYPDLQVAGMYSPPFGDITDAELEQQCAMINASHADVVWVALGCPKQETWMFRARQHLQPTVVLAVGQAIDITAGTLTRAPRLFRRFGLEWLYRLFHSPRRLWKRYLVYNLIFVVQVFKTYVFSKKPLGQTTHIG